MNQLSNPLSIWHIAREYDGLAESGGVKDVVKGLAESLVKLGHKVTVVLPFYGYMQHLNLNIVETKKAEVIVGNHQVALVLKKLVMNKVTIYCVDSPCYEDKQHPYTEPSSGVGYGDSLYMNIVLAKAVIFLADSLGKPDIMHLHDAHTALIPSMMEHNKHNLQFVLTIHNAGWAYQERYGNFDEVSFFTGIKLEKLQQTMIEGQVNPYALASQTAHLTTVSPQYAQDLVNGKDDEMHGLSAFFQNNHITIKGIYNGIDIGYWRDLHSQYYPLLRPWQAKKHLKRMVLADNGSPKDETKKYGHFNRNLEWPLYFFHSRLVEQKGVGILIESIKLLLAQKIKANFLIIGQGSSYFHGQLINLAQNSGSQVVFINDYDDTMIKRAWAASDFFLVPSIFEPCGLTDLYAVMLGSVPIGHKTGGLHKIEDYELGFLVDELSVEIFSGQINEINGIYLNKSRAIKRVARRAYRQCCRYFDWLKVVKLHYSPFYYKILAEKGLHNV